jgi:catalase
MASHLPANTMDKITQAVMGHKADKISQLAGHSVEPDENSRITTDYGVRQNNTDEWLRVTTNGQTGPMLLEDHFGREKVRCTPYCHPVSRP